MTTGHLDNELNFIFGCLKECFALLNFYTDVNNLGRVLYNFYKSDTF